MSRNFQVVSTCISGNGGGAGMEGLPRQMQHHRGILADRIEHHRVAALGGDFADDVDAFGFEPLEMGQTIGHENVAAKRSGWTDEQTRGPNCGRVPASARDVGLRDRARTALSIARFERVAIDVFDARRPWRREKIFASRARAASIASAASLSGARRAPPASPRPAPPASPGGTSRSVSPVEDLRNAADIGGDERHAGRGRLQHEVGHRFRPRGQHDGAGEREGLARRHRRQEGDAARLSLASAMSR